MFKNVFAQFSDLDVLGGTISVTNKSENEVKSKNKLQIREI